MSEERQRLLDALDGDPVRVRVLVNEWIPIVQVRVARALLRRKAPCRDARQEVEDLSQDVFAALFAEDARVLRSWDPTRGLSLRNFVGLVAERHTGAILKSSRRNPWTESPAERFELDGHLGEDAGLAPALESKEFLLTLFDLVQQALTPRGLGLFERLVVREETVEDVCQSTGMSVDAVYAWRSRLIKLTRRLGTELMRKLSSSRLVAANATTEKRDEPTR